MIYLLSPAFRNGLRNFTKYLLITCAVAIASWPVEARPEQGPIRQIPVSQISISQIRLYETTEIGKSGECVSFVNQAHVTAVRVLFLHSLIDQDGNVVYADTHEAKGEFAPGVLIQGENEVLCRHGDLNLGGGTVHHNGNLGSMVTSVAQVDYSDGTSWHAGPDIVGTSLSQPDVDIQITKTFSFEPADATQECVSFSNTGTRTVRRVQFMLSHIADDASDVVDDPLDVRSTYAPGTSQANSCRGWNGSLTPTVGTAPDPAAQPQILVLGKPARLVSWVNTIEFTDGTSWHAPGQEKGAASAAAVANKLDYSQSVWGPKVPEIAGAYTQQPGSGIDITKAFVWDPGAPNECVDFVNRSTKPVKRARFVFSHFDSDHTRLGQDEPMDSRPRAGNYEAGVTHGPQCRTFKGAVFLPSFWNGGSSEPQVVFNLQPSTLSVSVEEVEYADGTLWRTTAP